MLGSRRIHAVFDKPFQVAMCDDAEGRLEEDGTLACSYHGWRFGPDGKCTMIPQVCINHARRSGMYAACLLGLKSHATFAIEGRGWPWNLMSSTTDAKAVYPCRRQTRKQSRPLAPARGQRQPRSRCRCVRLALFRRPDIQL